MYLGLCLLGVIAVVSVITSLATRPDTRARDVRDLDRRTARLRACPDRATILDVERTMLAHPLPGSTVARVLAAAAERRLGARTMWCWADRFGADKLVLATDADVTERRLQRHLDAGTTPDWDAWELFAGLNHDALPGGMPIREILDLDAVPSVDELSFDAQDWATQPQSAVPVATDADLSQFDDLPPLFAQGLPVARSIPPPLDASTERPSTERPGAGGDGPRPMVA